MALCSPGWGHWLHQLWRKLTNHIDKTWQPHHLLNDNVTKLPVQCACTVKRVTCNNWTKWWWFFLCKSHWRHPLYYSPGKKGKLEEQECLRSEIPPAAPWLPTLGIHIRSKIKTRQSQSCKFKKKITKNLNFAMLLKTLHGTHLLKLLDKMYKYEMDPTRTVGTTERTRDAGRTDRRTDWVKPIYPQQLRCVRGIITAVR